MVTRLGRIGRFELGIRMALLVSQRSTCSRANVGCVLTDARYEQFWVGYNGGYRGGPNDCIGPKKPGLCGCIHAEANAVMKADRGIIKYGFVTTAPCLTCAMALINANVQGITYLGDYRDSKGLEVLQLAGVRVIKYNLEDLNGQPA